MSFEKQEEEKWDRLPIWEKALAWGLVALGVIFLPFLIVDAVVGRRLKQ